jgi:hypothetical protein
LPLTSSRIQGDNVGRLYFAFFAGSFFAAGGSAYFVARRQVSWLAG